MTSTPSSGSNLDFYRKQAKQLVRDVRAGEGSALERIRPQLRHIVSLADAQLVIAREQGFESWAAFQQSVGANPGAPAPEPVAARTALAELAELLRGDVFAGTRGAFERLRAALDGHDASGAAHCACWMEWALRKLAQGHAVETEVGREDRVSAEPTLEPAAAERARRALESLARVVREEALDLSAIRCSFCLKGNREVKKLIRGQQGYICDACTSVAADILRRQTD
jgi:hypothetical protein